MEKISSKHTAISLYNLRKDITKAESKERATVSERFFKTGIGEYGEGDVFVGLTVPQSRMLAKKYKDLAFTDITELLQSVIHEERLIALLILVHNFVLGSQAKKKEIFEFYLTKTRCINNWDLVDLSADKIVGVYLFDKDKSILYKLATSKNIWERRIAIVATYAFIKQNQYEETLKVAQMLLFDLHDLIQKAVGWMLREVGKRDQKIEEAFLKKHYKTIPRTTLRYAIERFDELLRKRYLEGKI